MGPLRIGFIGLSASGGWASNAHIPFLQQASDTYVIHALCNSSVEAAEAAKKHFNLSDSTKCYASPSELAADPDIDLVVCSVRVDRHYDAIKPAVENGKSCFVEWPLGANLSEAEELVNLARQSGSKTMIGLQARMSPFIHKIKNLVEGGAIGKVLSATVVSTAGNFGPTESAKLQYFTDKKVGGNMVSIHFGHMIDYITFILGELSSFHSLLSIQRENVQIVDKNSAPIEKVKKDTHDQIMLQGKLERGGVLSVHQRGGGPFKDDPGLTFRIYGETGEIKVIAGGSFLQIGYPLLDLQVHDFSTDEIKRVEWQDSIKDNFEDMPLPARNVARLYKAFSSQDETYPTWEDAYRRHKLLDELYKSSEQERLGSYL